MAKSTQDNVTKTLNFINNYISSHGYPPTVREICKELKVSSSATAQYYLNKLEEEGKIRRSSTKNRTIEVIDQYTGTTKPKVIYAPIVGTVTAGTPILATECIEGSMPLPESMFKTSEELFLLTVSGESMINAGILNGDKIIVKKQSTAQNGEIVVALVDDSATVKRFYKENGHFRLQPENDNMEPFILDDVQILGVVVGLLRKF
ncbi:MAG: transcriptional repressor LexA [Christensenellales bacterium]